MITINIDTIAINLVIIFKLWLISTLLSAMIIIVMLWIGVCVCRG